MSRHRHLTLKTVQNGQPRVISSLAVLDGPEREEVVRWVCGSRLGEQAQRKSRAGVPNMAQPVSAEAELFSI